MAKFKDKKGLRSDADHKLQKNTLWMDDSANAEELLRVSENKFSTDTIVGFGAVDEWFKSHAWKACVG